MNVIIYGLYEEDWEGRWVRYVGKTTQTLEKRMQQHLQDLSGSTKSKWLQEAQARGAKLGMEVLLILQDPTEDEWVNAEKMQIAYYKELHAIYNSTKGGEGRRYFITAQDIECPVCGTVFYRTRTNHRYCREVCRDYVKKVERIERPEQVELYLNKYCKFDCTCRFCTEVMSTVTDKPYVNPRTLDPFSRIKSHIF